MHSYLPILQAFKLLIMIDGCITLPVHQIYSCDLETFSAISTGMCRLQQDNYDNMQWTENSGPTPTGADNLQIINGQSYPATGPSVAYEGNNYIFIDSSNRQFIVEMARLFVQGSSLPKSGKVCLSFAYSMNGFGIGKLQVAITENNDERVKWRLKGNQNTEWLMAAVDLEMDDVTQVGIEGFTSGFAYGDIAIDQIQLRNGLCSVHTIYPYRSLHSQYIWKCDFQAPGNASAFCNMDHLSMDLLEWDLKLGSKPGEISKPAGMYYLFMSASGYGEGESVSVLVPKLSKSEICLEFRYIMSGSVHLEIVRGLYKAGRLIEITIETTIQGNQDNEWKVKRLSISDISRDHQIGFRAVIGNGQYGDVGLDDINVSQGSC